MLLDIAIDDRDAGVVETAKGSLLVTNFTSLAYEPFLAERRISTAEGNAAMSPEQLRPLAGCAAQAG